MWDFIVTVFDTFIFDPILNLVVFVINVLPNDNLGIAIIFVTIVVKFILLPFSKKSIKSQKKLLELRPKLKEIEQKYKNDRQTRAQEQLALYRQYNVNPFGVILFPLFIQLPVLIGLYRVFLTDFTDIARVQENLYSFISYSGNVSVDFLSISLAESSIILATIAATAQFIQSRSLSTQTKSSSQNSDFQKSMNLSMMYMLPLIIFLFGTGIPGVIDGFPAGISLYWAVGALFMYFQQKFINQQEEKGQVLEQTASTPENKTEHFVSSQTNPNQLHKKKKKKKKKHRR